MRHVAVPRQIPAGRPLERVPVPVRRRNPALQLLLLLRRTMPLTVYQSIPCELKGPFLVLAGRVLAEADVAGWIGFRRHRGTSIGIGGVVGGEIERFGFGIESTVWCGGDVEA